MALRPVGACAHLVLGLTEDSEVSLGHRENAFGVSIGALDCTVPSKVSYSRRLKGVDRAWINSGNPDEAPYASVRPARYLFRVIAAGADGVWSEEGAAMTLVARPPWWATWWARLPTVLVVAALVTGVVRLRAAAARRRSAWLEERVDAQTRELTDAQRRLQDELPPDDYGAQTVSHVRSAALLAAALTRQLLATRAVRGEAGRSDRTGERDDGTGAQRRAPHHRPRVQPRHRRTAGGAGGRASSTSSPTPARRSAAA